MPNLKKKYHEEVIPALQKQFKYSNVMMVPKLRSIVVTMGFGAVGKEKNTVQAHVQELALITGQHPVLTKAKKAISNFGIRIGQVVGAKVTLRGERMFWFLQLFTDIFAPRLRDFRGFPSAFDGRGNYSVGISDQMSFPQLNLDKAQRDKVYRPQGLSFTFVTSAKTDEEGLALLTSFGFPFKHKQEQ